MENFYLAALVLGGIAFFWFALPYAIRRLEVRKCDQVCRGKRLLVLSFDDGPSAGLTPRVLDLLQELDIKASFFFIGNRAMSNPDLVRRAATEGHDIGGHTDRHLNAWKTLPVAHCRDVLRGQRALETLIGPTLLFRAPYGKMSLASLVLVRLKKLWPAWWTIDPKDSLKPRSHEDVLAELAGKKGGIVLLHDHDKFPDPGHDEYVLNLVRKLKAAAAKNGLHFATISQLRSLCDAPRAS